MFIYIFLVYGMTNIITQSSIFEPLRIKINEKNPMLGLLVSCPMCMGFWVGIFALFCGYVPMRDNVDILPIPIVNSLLYAVLIGSIASGVAWLMHNVVSLIGYGADYLKASTVLQEYERLEDELNDEKNTIIISE